MQFVVTVNTIAECLRTDCSILGNQKINEQLIESLSIPKTNQTKSRFEIEFRSRYASNTLFPSP